MLHVPSPCTPMDPRSEKPERIAQRSHIWFRCQDILNVSYQLDNCRKTIISLNRGAWQSLPYFIIWRIAKLITPEIMVMSLTKKWRDHVQCIKLIPIGIMINSNRHFRLQLKWNWKQLTALVSLMATPDACRVWKFRVAEFEGKNVHYVTRCTSMIISLQYSFLH